MTQPDLFTSLPPARPKKRVRVPRSSVAAYLERPRDGRIGDVLWWLSFREFNGDCPTSAELASWLNPAGGGRDIDTLLYVRRGLSDALAAGLVCHAGERKCEVSGRVCLTWAVVSR